jgi:predicted RNA methylase
MEPSYQTNTGGFPLGHHLEMVMDGPRVAAIKAAIDAYASKDKSFIELGIGSGIFLEHARRVFGSVTGVERDPAIREVAMRTMATPGPANWDIAAGDAQEVDLERRFDVMLCEMLSTWCIIEPQVPIMHAARDRLMMPGGRIIPGRVINLIELGHVPFGVGPVSLPTPFLTLTGIRGPTIMSVSKVAHELDFMAANPINQDMSGTVEMTSLVDGVVNCVRLTSLVELAPGINWFSSDTLMPPMVYPLRDAVEVNAGETAKVGYQCRFGAGLEKAAFWIRS